MGRNPKGFTLIGALIAAGVAGIALVGINQMLVSSLRSQKRTDQNFDLTALRAMLLSSISCSDSLPGGTCTAGAALNAVQRVDATTTRQLASNVGAGTKYGSFNLKAECAPLGRGIVFKVARLTASGTLTSTANSAFETDPFKKTKIKWNDPGALLFDPGIEVCGNSSTASPSGIRMAILNIQCNPLSTTTTGPSWAASRNKVEVDLSTATPTLIAANSTTNCGLTVPGMGSFQSAPFDLNRPAYYSFGYTGSNVRQQYANLAFAPQIALAYLTTTARLRVWLRDADDPNIDGTGTSQTAINVTVIQP